MLKALHSHTDHVLKAGHQSASLYDLLSVAQWALANHNDAVGEALDVSDYELAEWKSALDKFLTL